MMNYQDYHDWPPLPELIRQTNPMNSEYFGLGLTKREFALSVSQAEVMGQLSSNVVNCVTSTWYCYNSEVWGTWGALSPTNEPRFPATGTVKPEFDYAGADAAARVAAEASRLTPNSPASKINWTAAAKPFGHLNEHDRPNEFGVVLPAFLDVRLIPIDASSAPAGGAFNLDWRDHIEGHLDGYLVDGRGALTNDCWYCLQLQTWETPDRQDPLSFRQVGRGKLMDPIFTNSCHSYTSGPGRRGGGRRRGH
jgi:hypothetical protein